MKMENDVQETNDQPEKRESLAESQKSVQNAEDEMNRKIREILQRQQTFADHQDESLHASYSKFKVPYPVTCELRYNRKRELCEQQFQHELEQLMNNQPTAYEASRFNKHLCITTLWPPLHNRAEIKFVETNFFRMTPKERKRLQYIRNTKII